MPAFVQDAAKVGTLELNDVAIAPSSYFRLRNPQVLWMPAPKRGNDIILPGVDGVLPRARRKASRTVTLEMFVNGTLSSFNANQANPYYCLKDNLKLLRTGVFDPAGPIDIEYTQPGESKVTVKGHALGLEEVQTDPKGRWMLVELDLLIVPGQV
jgi:hypothetical protein